MLILPVLNEPRDDVVDAEDGICLSLLQYEIRLLSHKGLVERYLGQTPESVAADTGEVEGAIMGKGELKK